MSVTILQQSAPYIIEVYFAIGAAHKNRYSYGVIA